MATPAPVAPESNGKGFIQRELNGATFLTLEHVGHMALVVIVSALVVSGLCSALSMWFGTNSMASTMAFGSAGLLGGAALQAHESVTSLGIVAALLVLVPALVVLDRRTRAEWNKRRGYAGRLAYKAPVYGALGVLGALLVAAKIQALYVIIASLAYIGVPGAPIGGMYVGNFIPALVGIAVFSAAAWYVFNLAKGRDYGRKFSMGAVAVSGALVIALFITSLVVLHDGEKTFAPNQSGGSTVMPQEPGYDEDYYRDLLDKYSR